LLETMMVYHYWQPPPDPLVYWHQVPISATCVTETILIILLL